MPGRKIEVTEIIYGHIPPDDLAQEILRILIHELRLSQPQSHTVNTLEKTDFELSTSSREHRR